MREPIPHELGIGRLPLGHGRFSCPYSRSRPRAAIPAAAVFIQMFHSCSFACADGKRVHLNSCRASLQRSPALACTRKQSPGHAQVLNFLSIAQSLVDCCGFINQTRHPDGPSFSRAMRCIPKLSLLCMDRLLTATLFFPFFKQLMTCCSFSFSPYLTLPSRSFLQILCGLRHMIRDGRPRTFANGGVLRDAHAAQTS